VGDLYHRLQQIKEQRDSGTKAPPRPRDGALRSVSPGNDWKLLFPGVFQRRAVLPLSLPLPRECIGPPELTKISSILSGPHEFGAVQPVFVDIETTGLSSGAGTVAFLIGLGVYTDAGVEVTQLYLSDLGAEAAMLSRLVEILQGYTSLLLVSYNGATFDIPVLRSRAIMTGIKLPPFRHIDLLHPVRRLYRSVIGKCNLSAVEQSVLGLYREFDIPSAEVPERYLRVLRGDDPAILFPVVEHHLYDIAHLGALLSHLQYITRAHEPGHFPPGTTPPDPAGAARLFLSRGTEAQRDGTRRWLEAQVVQSGPRWQDLADLLVPVLRRAKKWDSYELILNKLQQRRGELRDFVNLAIFLEHRKKEYSRALQIVIAAANICGWSPELIHRAKRLRNKLSGHARDSGLLVQVDSLK